MSQKFLGLCVVFLLPTLLSAAEPPERLIEQLGSPRHRERQQAATALLQHGSAAIPPLEKARKHQDIEIRRQVEILLDHLIPRAEAETILAAPKLRLSYKDTPAVEALTDFARRARLPLALDSIERGRLARVRINLQTDELPVWEAYRRLCVACGVSESGAPADSTVSLLTSETTRPPSSSGSSSRGGPPGGFSGRSPSSSRRLTNAPLVLLTGPGVAFPSAYSGSLRIQALDSKVLRTPAGEATVQLVFTADDRIRLMQVEYLRVEKSRDIFGDQVPTPGFSLEPPEPLMEAMEPLDRPTPRLRYLPACQVDLKFQVPNRRIKLLDELTGFVGMRVEAPSGTLVDVADVVKASGTTVTGRDGTTVKVVEAVMDPDTKRLRLKIEVQRPDGVSEPARPGGFGGRGGSTRSGTSLTRADLEQQGLNVVDAKGETVTLWRAELAPRRDPPGPREFTLVYEPTKDQAAGAFRVQVTGRRVALIEVPFTLRNVPLP